MNGKAKCKILREIRRRIAEENDISFITKDCTYQGECRGTCPKCEAELRFLEQQLERRRRLGKTVTLAALAASLSLGLTACGTPKEENTDFYASSESAAKRREKRDRENDQQVVGEIEVMGEFPDENEGNGGELAGEPVEYVEPLEGDVVCDPEEETVRETTVPVMLPEYPESDEPLMGLLPFESEDMDDGLAEEIPELIGAESDG